MKLTERVARAIVNEFKAPLKDAEFRMAKAAIQAIREPTEKMINAGYATRPTEECWRVMIDAALKE